MQTKREKNSLQHLVYISTLCFGGGCVYSEALVCVVGGGGGSPWWLFLGDAEPLPCLAAPLPPPGLLNQPCAAVGAWVRVGRLSTAVYQGSTTALTVLAASHLAQPRNGGK